MDPNNSTEITEAPQNTDQKNNEVKHLLYAVELLLFSVVGWGWIALREAMGSTPVLDVSLFISMLVSSSVNLFVAIFTSAKLFRPFACAMFSHAACILLLYIYSLIQSTTPGHKAFCCNTNTTAALYPLDRSYAAAFFGGLTAHQIPAAVTLAFLVFFLVITGGQATAYADRPGLIHSLVKSSGLAANTMLALHPMLMAKHAPLCNDNSALVTANAVFITMAMILMVDFRFLAIIFIKKIYIIAISAAEFLASLGLFVFANLLAASIDSEGNPSWPLVCIMGIILITNVFTIGLDLNTTFIFYKIMIVPYKFDINSQRPAALGPPTGRFFRVPGYNFNLKLATAANSKRN